jgi:hypothetical protein
MDEIGSSQYLVDDTLVNATFGTHSSIFVVLQLAIGEVSHCSIDEHISRTSVKVVTAFNIAFGEDTEVGNATNVLNCTVQSG